MPSVDHLIAALDQPDTTDEAIDELYDLGETALPALCRCVDDSRSTTKARELAAVALGAVVPRGVEWLLGRLLADDKELADLAAWGLRWNHGPDVTEPRLGKMLESQDPAARRAAARALSYISIDISRWPDSYLVAAADPDPDVRYYIFTLLLHLAEAAMLEGFTFKTDVAEVCSRALDDSDGEVREKAAALSDALETMPPQDC